MNEDNCIGRQTFSIQEIQKEWALSLNALTVAIEEFEMNVHGGREKSLLASIVGLTTRFPPSLPASPISIPAGDSDGQGIRESETD